MEALKDATGADSLTEVIRRSFAVYETLIDQQNDGAEVVVRKGKKEREILLVP